MKNFLLLAFLSLIVFNSCVKDDNDCFRVTYGLVSTDAEGDAPVDANRYSNGDVVVVLDTDATRPGFNFTGWNTRADGTGDPYQPGDTFIITAHVALYAQWEEQVVTIFEVVYNANGGSGGATDGGLTSGQQYTILSPDETQTIRPGYTFTQWNTDPTGLDGDVYTPGDVITVGGNLTLYAQWEEDVVTFDIVYLSNNGTGVSLTENALSGEPYTIRSNFRAGMSQADFGFTVWNTESDGSGTSYSGEDVIIATGDLTLYAQWEAATTVAITYLPNQGDGLPRVDYAVLNSNYTFLTGADLGMSRDGFTFVGWNTLPDGSEMAYDAGSNLSVTEDITLYAQWQGPPEFTITYDANSGIGGTSVSLPQGTLHTVLTDAQVGVSNSLFVFDSWNTNSDGTGTKYDPGDTFAVTQDVTLYAQWIFQP